MEDNKETDGFVDLGQFTATEDPANTYNGKIGILAREIMTNRELFYRLATIVKGMNETMGLIAKELKIELPTTTTNEGTTESTKV